jgi:acyl dehydratase
VREHLLEKPPRPLPALVRGALTAPFRRGPRGDTALPARAFTVREVRADPGARARYARLCGFPEDGTLPAPYPHVLAFGAAVRLMTAPGFPFPLPGLVHTAVTLTLHRTLDAREAPALRVHAEGVVPHRRGTAFDVVTRAAVGGEEVWHSRSTYLYRHRREDPPPAEEEPEAAPVPPGAAGWTLPAGLGRRYAAVSGDLNPLHLHPLTARLSGFPRPLAHGMWTFARCLAATAPDGGRGPLTASARFRAPVLLPARVVLGHDPATGRFALHDGGGRGRVHLTGQVSSAPRGPGGPGPSSRSS